MLGVWSVNGFAQAFMWPPLVKIMTTLFTDETYKASTVKVSWGSSIGTIAVYLISPLVIALSSWKAVFFVSAFCGIVMIFVWNRFCVDIDVKPLAKAEKADKANHKHILFNPLMIGVMVAIALQGMLRDGVTTWMPSYISETYNLSNIIAILTGVILPLFSIITFQITSKLHRTVLKNPLSCAGVIFLAGTIAALGLVFTTGRNAALSVIFSALLTGSMHGVNLILICMIPAYFKKYGNVSTVSGILNSCTYVGSAVSTYGIAIISEKFDWSTTLLIWLLIAVLGTLICFISIKPWNKRMA
jgi:OPA family glycerol-3-phosphate transporter-like MFS transporter